MSEALKLKRHLFITSVENAEGTQTWWVDAASKEDALAKFEAGNCEIYSSEVEVTKLGEPEYLGATSLDDFGDAENKTEIESLRAERDALMEKHFQAVEAQVKLIHERDAMKADAERLDLIERKLFSKSWNGVVDSGSRVTWRIASGHQHTTAIMVGNTFRAAIDAAKEQG